MGEPRRYNILGTLGKGGFGTVYKAQLKAAPGSRIVALRCSTPRSPGKRFARRARRRARVLGLVRHRAIVQVDGLVVLQGHWVVVMEYVSGVDLKRLMQAGPVPPGVALEIIEEVAQALDAAYRQPGPEGKPLGLLHRDIKPSNLRITERGEVKVLDFGTARANFQSREAQTQALTFGTVGYMAPERMDFEDLPAGDVPAA
ncbi:MAG: serine/threonine protein kinase [Deltaproteobacteria bacterium]|nr:serine/threonine protein kinase [Deltaproteobacteria bacterium]